MMDNSDDDDGDVDDDVNGDGMTTVITSVTIWSENICFGISRIILVWLLKYNVNMPALLIHLLESLSNSTICLYSNEIDSVT